MYVAEKIVEKPTVILDLKQTLVVETNAFEARSLKLDRRVPGVCDETPFPQASGCSTGATFSSYSVKFQNVFRYSKKGVN